jgi:hypothetical protein
MKPHSCIVFEQYVKFIMYLIVIENLEHFHSLGSCHEAMLASIDSEESS